MHARSIKAISNPYHFPVFLIDGVAMFVANPCVIVNISECEYCQKQSLLEAMAIPTYISGLAVLCINLGTSVIYTQAQPLVGVRQEAVASATAVVEKMLKIREIGDLDGAATVRGCTTWRRVSGGAGVVGLVA